MDCFLNAAIGAACLLIIIGLAQIVMVVPFCLAMRRQSQLETSVNRSAGFSEWPCAAIIISLRGADSTMKRCLEGLLCQSYPARYQVIIIVDSPVDPAWQVAEQISQRESTAAQVRMEPLFFRRSTCSIKCSALIQAVSELDPECQVVAFADADIVPHATWLQDLAAPLVHDARVGATTGNRWFMPAEFSWGALARSVWSAGALVQMYLLKIAWGGSMAIRRDLLFESQLPDQWARSFNDDLLVGAAAKARGLDLRFVPSNVMVDQETCSVYDLLPWVTRQLLHVRFYHPGWSLIVAAGLIISLTIPCAFIAAGVALLAGYFQAALWILLGLTSYVIIMMGLFWSIQRAIAAGKVQPGRECRWHFGAGRLAASICLSHFVYSAALLGAMFRRTISWRGVTYYIWSASNVFVVR